MNVCEWQSLRSALAHFATFRGSTQSQRHIKPLHWYVACRLVVEGGFEPEEIVPRLVYAAPDLRKVTARREWDAASPAFDGAGLTDLDYEPRKT